MTKKSKQQTVLEDLNALPGKRFLLMLFAMALGVLYLSVTGQGTGGRSYPSQASTTTSLVENNFIEKVLAQNTNENTTDETDTTELESETEPTAADILFDTKIGDLLINQLGMQSCKVERTTSSAFKTGDGIVSTVSIEMPLLNWLNSVEETGTETSAFTPPCIVDLREDFRGSSDWTSEYAVNAGLHLNGQNEIVPIDANGAVCLYNDFRNFTGEQTVAPENLVSQFKAQSTETEKKSGTSGLGNFLNKVFPGVFGTAEDQVSLVEYLEPDDYVCTGIDSGAKNGTETISALYTGDSITTAERLVVPTTDSAENPEVNTFILPLMERALGVAYEEELYKLNTAGYTCERTIHRDNTGVKAIIKKAYYSDDRSYEDFETELVDDENKYDGIYDNDKGQFLGEERFDAYFPWLYQTNKMYRRLSTIYSDLGPDRDLLSKDYYSTFNNIAEEFNNRKSLDFKASGPGVNGESKAAFDQLDLLLKNPENVMYCGDIDSFAQDLEVVYGVDADGNIKDEKGRKLHELIQHTDCVDNSQCTTGLEQEQDPLLDYLCSKGAVDSRICENNDIEDIGSQEFLQCTTDEYSIALPDDVVESVNSGNEDADGESVPTGLASPTTGVLFQEYHLSHPGIDIATGTGTPIKAVASGTVIFAGDARVRADSSKGIFSGYGNVVLIEHDGGKYCSLYAHMSAISVSNGQSVSARTKVGEVGSTGNSTGPHLHFELRHGCGSVVYYHSSAEKQSDYFIDPTCVYFGNCNFEIGTEQSQNSNDSVDNLSGLTETNDICFAENPEEFVSDFDPDTLEPITKDIRDVIDLAKCGGASGWIATNGNTVYDRYLVDLSTSVGKQEGTQSTGSIYALAERVSKDTGVPTAKILAHLHVEYFGAGNSSYLSDIGNIYNGNLDQSALSQPNICGCLGPGQFCPGTARSYFMPPVSGENVGGRYEEVFKCMEHIGFQGLEYGDPISPSYVGAATCAMAINMKEAANTSSSVWIDNEKCFSATDSFIISNSDICPNMAATRDYYGSCETSSGRNYCVKTSDPTADGSILGKYQQRL